MRVALLCYYLEKEELIIVDKKKLLVKKTYGGSKRLWNNQHMGTCSALCEICGTTTTRDPEGPSLVIDTFLGQQMVEECCGSLIDQLYDEFGEEFAREFIKDFADDPMNSRFAILKIVLEDAFKRIGKKAAELGEQTEKNQAALDLLNAAK